MATPLPSEEAAESTQQHLRLVADPYTVKDATDNWLSVYLNTLRCLILDQFELMICLALAILCILLLLVLYFYLCSKCRKIEFIYRLNELERCLLSYHFHNEILKQEVELLRKRLKEQSRDVHSSLEMIQSIEECLLEKTVRVSQLEKELENLQEDLAIATECGQQLHKNATNLLERNADEHSIKKDLKNLIKQSTEQNGILHEIKDLLYCKPRKDLEAQTIVSNNFKSLNEDLKGLQKLLNGVKVGKTLEKQLTAKDHTIQVLTQELQILSSKMDMEKNQHQISLAKIDILEKSLKSLRSDSEVNLPKLMDAINAQSELSLMKDTHAIQLTRLTTALKSKESLEQQLKKFNKKFDTLKKDFDSLKSSKSELQITLDAFKSLFNDKETQMNKQLVEKELMCLRQQDEIKELKTTIQASEENVHKTTNETTKSLPPFLFPLPPILLPVVNESSGSHQRSSKAKAFKGNRFNSKSVDSIPRSVHFRQHQNYIDQLGRANITIPYQKLSSVPSSPLSTSLDENSSNCKIKTYCQDQSSLNSSSAPTVIEIHEK